MHRIYRATPIAIVAASSTDAFVTSPNNVHLTSLPRTQAANNFAITGQTTRRAHCELDIISAGEVSEMDAFGKSGDRAHQFNNSAKGEKFRSQLEASTTADQSLVEEIEQELRRQQPVALLVETRLEHLDDRDPTMPDKILSILPYLFLLIDGLQYGQFFLEAEDVRTNPIMVALTLLHSLFRSQPLLGILPFFALNHISGISSLNRLVRFNAQHAIFLEIALMFPLMIIRLDRFVAEVTGVPTSQLALEISSNTTFGVLSLTVLYCIGNSLSGTVPDGIPLIFRGVADRISKMDVFDDGQRNVSHKVSRG